MRKLNFVLGVGCILSLFIGMTFSSCSKDDSYLQSKLKVDEQHSTEWSKNLRRAVEVSKSASKIFEDQVVLNGFQYLGKIETESDKQRVIDAMFSQESSTLELHHNGERMTTVGFVRLGDVYNSQWDELKNNVTNRIELGKTEVVKLDWAHNGEQRSSYAIVDAEKGVLFDVIGNYAADYSKFKGVQKSYRVVRRPSFTRSLIDSLDSLDSMANDTIGSGGDYQEVHIANSQEDVSSLTGLKFLYRYDIHCISVFNNDGILINSQAFATYDADWENGWKCVAAARTTGGQVNVSSYHSFAWCWAWGTNDDPDVYYYESGNTYEVGGGHLSDKGAATHYHRHR